MLHPKVWWPYRFKGASRAPWKVLVDFPGLTMYVLDSVISKMSSEYDSHRVIGCVEYAEMSES